MVYRLLLLSFFSLSLGASELTSVEEKLYNYIKKTQIKQHHISRYIGTWPTYPKYSGARVEIAESNSFMTLQTIVLLKQVNEVYKLEGVKNIFSLANKQIQNYVDDAKKTDEIKGTISFWPLIKTDEGKFIRSFDTKWYNSSMRILNIGNDFDTSSQAFSWFYMTNTHKDFLDNFVKNVTLHVDKDRKNEHFSNTKWKGKDSGAFLTWAEDEAPKKSNNRIMDLVNDVDCVVNLNILTALSNYENHIDSLPPKTQSTRENSCHLIKNVIKNHKEDICGTWYTRESHFYLAFAKAYKADTFCIADEKDEVLKRAKRKARELLNHPRLKAYTEIAEYIIIIKDLSKRRTYLTKILLDDLEKELKKGITEKEDYAYLPSRHSLFGGKAFKYFHFNWYGRANATALALRALSMK